MSQAQKMRLSLNLKYTVCQSASSSAIVVGPTILGIEYDPEVFPSTSPLP
jgi:hypothetical protein